MPYPDSRDHYLTRVNLIRELYLNGTIPAQIAKHPNVNLTRWAVTLVLRRLSISGDTVISTALSTSKHPRANYTFGAPSTWAWRRNFVKCIKRSLFDNSYCYCPQCHQVKLTSEFYTHNIHMRDRCSLCARTYAKAFRDVRRELATCDQCGKSFQANYVQLVRKRNNPNMKCCCSRNCAGIVSRSAASNKARELRELRELREVKSTVKVIPL